MASCLGRQCVGRSLNTMPKSYSVLLFAAATTVLLALSGCGASPSAAPTPAGAAEGRNTFIYLYSDN
jgi:hypothetical protein